MTVPPFLFHVGTQPLLVSIPHMGTYIPPDVASSMTSIALETHDTDWHLDRLYGFARDMGASVLMASHSRYVIDLNRPPDGTSLYPGQSVTGLCPVDTFDETPLYQPGLAPSDAETERRLQAYWHPYHDQLTTELLRLKAKYGQVALWDAHSIRSVVPRFFDGKLADFNLGTANGTSCAPELADKLLTVAKAAPECSAVLNGRFMGGYITRHYGNPSQGVHAVQLEMTQCIYMDENWPFVYRPERAAHVKQTLRCMLDVMLDFVVEKRC